MKENHPLYTPSYSDELIALRMSTDSLLCHFTKGQYKMFIYEAIFLHRQDVLTGSKKRNWEDLGYEEKEYYIRLAVLFKTGIDIKVEQNFHA